MLGKISPLRHGEHGRRKALSKFGQYGLDHNVMENYRRLICAAFVALVVVWLAPLAKNLAAQLTASGPLQSQNKPSPNPSPTPLAQAATKSAPPISSFFRISQASAVSAERRASSPAVAYNPDDNEYLVVWESDGLTDVKGVSDIYGQRINGATNERIGINFRISNLSDGDNHHSSNDPRVVYNRTAREYLVVWHGVGLVDSPGRFFEVYGQRLSRTGTEIGNDFRISQITELGKINSNVVRGNTQADVAWNSANNEYLVIWKGMGEPEEFVKMEIYGQRLKANGDLSGKHFRISHTTNQGPNFQANAPAVAYNSKDNQYFVVWTGGFKKEVQTEVWGKVVPAVGGELSTEDLRISEVSSADRRANLPHVAYNSGNNEYLVVFQANPLPGGPTAVVNDIVGQRIDAAKSDQIQPTYLRISNNTGAGSRVTAPRVIYNNVSKQYLVIWRSSRANAPVEISGQRLNSGGVEIEGDFQIANLATVGKDRSINDAAMIHNGSTGRYFVVWQGNALAEAASSQIYEIFGQQLK